MCDVRTFGFKLKLKAWMLYSNNDPIGLAQACSEVIPDSSH